MIYLIVGSNTYKAEQELSTIVHNQQRPPERVDATAITVDQLSDLIKGGNLFTQKRVIVLHGLSDNKVAWELMADWVTDLPSDTTLILVERKLDKRTKTYKKFAHVGTIIQADSWTEYECDRAEQWLQKLAQEHGLTLTDAQAHDMVIRAYIAGESTVSRVIDQFQLVRAINALSNLDIVTSDAIDTVLPSALPDTVFNLLEQAARSGLRTIMATLDDVLLHSDPHQVFAIVVGQWAQLAAVATADGPSSVIATELGVHPYVVKKLRAIASTYTQSDIHMLTKLAAELDARTKLSQVSPVDGLRRFIYAVALACRS